MIYLLLFLVFVRCGRFRFVRLCVCSIYGCLSLYLAICLGDLYRIPVSTVENRIYLKGFPQSTTQLIANHFDILAHRTQHNEMSRK